jgi:hypothetical protein
MRASRHSPDYERNSFDESDNYGQSRGLHSVADFVRCRQRSGSIGCGAQDIERRLIPAVRRCQDAEWERGMRMIAETGGRLAAAMIIFFLAGCGSALSTACQCPKPVAYDDATITKITAALRALPSDNVLHQAMDDYEDERDALRICLGGGRAVSEPTGSSISRMAGP